MTEFQHEVAVPELEHETARAEVPEVSRLEVWDMSELECETTVAEVPEVPRLEGPMLPDETVVVKLEAMMRPMELCASVWGEMAEAHTAIAGRGRLRR